MRGYLDRVTTLVKGFLDLVTIDSLYLDGSLMLLIMSRKFLEY